MNEDLFILSEVQVLECSASEFVGLVQVQEEVQVEVQVQVEEQVQLSTVR